MKRAVSHTIDEHPERGKIEYDLARGVPVRAVCKKYNLKKDACYRYRAKLPPQLKAAHLGNFLKSGADLDQLRIDLSEGLLKNMATQQARLLIMQDAAMDAGDRREAAYISRAIVRVEELVGKLLGEIQQHHVHTTLSVLIAPEYLELRSKLLRALQPYPDARRDIAAVLHSIEGPVAQRRAPLIEGNSEGANAATAA